MIRVDHRIVEIAAAEILHHRTNVIGRGEVIGLTLLRRHITGIDRGAARPADGVDHSTDQQIRNDAGIEAAWAKNDQVSIHDGIEGWRIGRRMFWLQIDLADRGLIARDARFPMQLRAIDKFGAKVDVRKRGGHHTSANVDDLAEFEHRLLEASSHLRQRGNEQISQRMAFEIRAISIESILEELTHKRFVIRQRHDAVPNVSRRRNVVLTPDSTGTATIVRHGHDRGDIDIVQLETAQQIGETGATADGDHVDIRHVRSKSVVRDDLRDRLSHGSQREDRTDDRVPELPEPNAEHGDAGNDQHESRDTDAG